MSVELEHAALGQSEFLNVHHLAVAMDLHDAHVAPRLPDVRQPGQVDDGVRRGLADHPLQGRRVLQVHLEQADLFNPRKVRVVDQVAAAHPVSPLEEMAGEPGADETADAGIRRALITGTAPGMKLIHSGGAQYQLYDLAEDPGERKDLSSDKEKLGPVLTRMQQLRARLKEVEQKPR